MQVRHDRCRSIASWKLVVIEQPSAELTGHSARQRPCLRPGQHSQDCARSKVISKRFAGVRNADRVGQALEALVNTGELRMHVRAAKHASAGHNAVCSMHQ